MGHIRLGTLPDTRPWRTVIAHIAGGASAAVVAAATSEAAVSGLDRGKNDLGVAHVVFLLARIPVAARKTEFIAALAPLGIHTASEPGLFDLTAAFASGVRTWHATTRVTRSDLGEMASLAATETLAASIGERVRALFANGDEVHRAVATFATKNGFAALGHEFFARFVRRFLLYHLGRELSQHVGGNGRFADHDAYSAFVTDLEVHCRETAVIVRNYAGRWHDKARFERGITETQAREFTRYCLGKKLRDELARRGQRHG